MSLYADPLYGMVPGTVYNELHREWQAQRARVRQLEKELAQVIGSPTLSLAAELARARQKDLESAVAERDLLRATCDEMARRLGFYARNDDILHCYRQLPHVKAKP